MDGSRTRQEERQQVPALLDLTRQSFSCFVSLQLTMSFHRSYKSLDGQTTPSLLGTNPSTPQPSSPDASHFHLLQDYGPVPSPLSPPSPDMPCSRDAQTPYTRDAHRLLYSEDTCGSTSDCTFEETVTYTHYSYTQYTTVIIITAVYFML